MPTVVLRSVPPSNYLRRCYGTRIEAISSSEIMELYNSTLTYQLRHAFENTKNEPFNVGVDSVHH